MALNLVNYQFKNPVRIPGTVIYLIIGLTRMLLLKAGLLTYSRIAQAGNPELARMLKGLSKSEALSLFTEAAQTTVDTVREETLDILRWHQEEGHTVILMSGGFQPFLQVVGNLLGINYTVGTELEEIDDYYTGRLAGSFCHGDDRVRLVRHFIESSGFNVSLSSSYAYGDRVHDIPTMEMVGHPVAVYPDEGLLTYAKEKGWTVIGDSAA
jgi:HAD superfamily hydrolase (TIGR01490 family)